MSAAPGVLGKSEAATPAWLTDRLRRAGVLPQGHVVAIREAENDAFTSRVVHLEVRYSIDAPPNAPTALLLKRMDRGWGEREIMFYRTVMDDRLDADDEVLVRQFEATFDPATGGSQLLLEDVSATHASPVSREDLLAGRGVPSRSQMHGIMKSLARFHSRRWEDERIGREEPFLVRPWYSDESSFRDHVARREREVMALDGAVPHWLVDFYNEALRRLPVLWERYLSERMATARALTVTHGDCYLTQWLCPRDGRGETYLVDFDSVSGNIGAFDLVYLLPSFWTSAHRTAHESDLRTYHETLMAEGVSRYAWEQLVLDYRLMLSFFVFDPVFDHADGAPRTYWWPKMSCLTSAYRDWESDRL